MPKYDSSIFWTMIVCVNNGGKKILFLIKVELMVLVEMIDGQFQQVYQIVHK